MKRREAIIVWLLFVIALALRTGWVSYRWAQNGAAFEFDDERLHWQLATNLVQRGALVSDDGRYAARMPLYPLFLAACAWLGQDGILVAKLVQALAGAATTWLAYHLARASLGSRPALLAGLLVACDPYAIFFANLLLSEIPFTLIALALTACAWHAATRAATPSSGRALCRPLSAVAPGSDRAACRPSSAWGLSFGVALLGPLALMTRPSAAGWVVALWLGLWVADRDRRRGTSRLALYAAALVLMMLPWGLRNRAVLGSYAWLSTNGGVTLYDAQGPQADGSSNQEFLHRLPELAGLGEAERDRTLRRLATEQMRRDPARVVRLAWVKFLRTWNFVPNVDGYRQWRIALTSAAFTGLVLVLAAIGVCRAVSRRDPGGGSNAVRQRLVRLLHLFVWLPVIYFTLVHCVFIGSLRYRVPLMPFVALAAATAFWRPATASNAWRHGTGPETGRQC